MEQFQEGHELVPYASQNHGNEWMDSVPGLQATTASNSTGSSPSVT